MSRCIGTADCVQSSIEERPAPASGGSVSLKQLYCQIHYDLAVASGKWLPLQVPIAVSNEAAAETDENEDDDWEPPRRDPDWDPDTIPDPNYDPSQDY